jgi:hypothetical protein
LVGSIFSLQKEVMLLLKIKKQNQVFCFLISVIKYLQVFLFCAAASTINLVR